MTPTVLDPACGPRMMWFDKKDPEVSEQIAREIERKCVGQMMPGAISISARIARGGDVS